MREGNFLRISCLALAEQAALEHRAEMTVSLLSTDMQVPDFAAIEPDNRHVFYFHDQESVLPPGMQEAVAQLIRLGRSWRQGAKPRTLVHCHGGVSRSTAATYILLCASMPDIEPAQHFETLLRLAVKPWPNIRMVGIADDILKAGGGMVAPVQAYRAAYPRRIDAYHRLNRRRGIVSKVQR